MTIDEMESTLSDDIVHQLLDDVGELKGTLNCISDVLTSIQVQNAQIAKDLKRERSRADKFEGTMTAVKWVLGITGLGTVLSLLGINIGN